MDNQFYDASERARIKQADRDRDSADLLSGLVSAKEMQRRNAFIPEDAAREAEILEWKEFS